MAESAHQTAESDRNPIGAGYKSLSLLTVGLRFARQNLSIIVAISFLPMVLRLIANIVQISYPLRPNGLFLVLLASAAAFAWQLTAISALLVEQLRGISSSPVRYIKFGLVSMPKVLLSHSLLLFAVFSSYLIVIGSNQISPLASSFFSASFMLGFFVAWAPAFVAGENFSKVATPKTEEFDPFMEEESFMPRKPRYEQVFTGMGILDIGVERSFQFAMKHFGFTVLIVLLAWCLKVLPAAFAAMLFGSSISFEAVAFEVIGTSLFGGILITAVGYNFLLLLPKEARDELSIQENELAEPTTTLEKRSSLLRLILASVVGLTLFATVFLMQVVRNEQAFPDKLKPAVKEVVRNNGDLAIRFTLNDVEGAYRWLDGARFRLAYHPDKGALEKTDANSTATGKESAAEVAPRKGGLLEYLQSTSDEEPADQSRLLAPKNFLIYSSAGKLLDERYFKPHHGPIKVEVIFDIGQKDPANPKLLYLSLDGEAQDIGPLLIPAALSAPQVSDQDATK